MNRVGLRSQGLAPAGNRAALSNIGNMMNGAQGARQTRSSKAKYVSFVSRARGFALGFGLRRLAY